MYEGIYMQTVMIIFIIIHVYTQINQCIVMLACFCHVRKMALWPDLMPYAVGRWPSMRRAAVGCISHLCLLSHTPSGRGEPHGPQGKEEKSIPFLGIRQGKGHHMAATGGEEATTPHGSP